MTGHAVPKEAFLQWHYKNDPTHVCFFSPQTFGWMARQWDAEMTFADGDVVLFRKRAAEPCQDNAAVSEGSS
jgi:hypothetical protein